MQENTIDSCRIETNEEEIEFVERQELTVNDIGIEDEGTPLSAVKIDLITNNHSIGKLP